MPEATFSLELVRLAHGEPAAAAPPIASILGEETATVRDALERLPMFVRHGVEASDAALIADQLSRLGCDVRLVDEGTGESTDIDALGADSPSSSQMTAAPSRDDEPPSSRAVGFGPSGRPGMRSAGGRAASARAQAALRSLQQRAPRPGTSSAPSITDGPAAAQRTAAASVRASTPPPAAAGGARVAAAPASATKLPAARPATPGSAPKVPAARPGPPGSAPKVPAARPGAPAAQRPSASMRKAEPAASAPEPARSSPPAKPSGVEAFANFSTRKCSSCGGSVERVAICPTCGWHKYEGERTCTSCNAKVELGFVPAPRRKLHKAVLGVLAALGAALAFVFGWLGFAVVFVVAAGIVSLESKLFATRCSKCPTSIREELVTAREQKALTTGRRAMRTAVLVLAGLAVTSFAMLLKKGSVDLEVGKGTWVVAAPGGQSTKKADSEMPSSAGRTKGKIITSTGGLRSVQLVVLGGWEVKDPKPSDVEVALRNTLSNTGLSATAPATDVAGKPGAREQPVGGRLNGVTLNGRIRALMDGDAVIVVAAAAAARDGADSPAVTATLESVARK